MTERVRITPDDLARASGERRERTRRVQAAFAEAAGRPIAEAVLPADPARVARTLVLALAAAGAFLPAALLSDAVAGEAVEAGAATRNVIAVLVLTLGPALVSIRLESAPDADDVQRARLAHRVAPLAVGAVLALTGLFPWVLRWPAVEGALVLQAPLALWLHVPRARACHLFVVGWGAIASGVLDDRALPSIAAVAAAGVLGAALDRSRDARQGPDPAGAAIPLGATAVVVALGALLFGATWLALPGLERSLPERAVVRRVPLAGGAGPSAARAFALLALVAVSFATWHFVVSVLARRRTKKAPPAAEPLPPSAPVSLDVSEGEVAAWPPGARRTLVRGYLAHLAALARLGIGRAPAVGPLEMARAVASRSGAAGEPADRLARAFEAARYSPEPVGDDAVARAEQDARAVEEALRNG